MPPPRPLSLRPDHARRFVRLALGLDQPAATTGAMLDHLGYVQIDPLNLCGRMHDLILRPRVVGYREGDLMRHMHGREEEPPPAADRRTAFEHHHPQTGILVAFPLDAWPHLLAAMHARTRRSGAWSGRLTPKQKPLAATLLAEIAARGPLSAEDFAGSGRARSVWGSATLAKATLQKLFFHGRLLIAARGPGNRRFYDLPERILPAATLARSAPPATDTARWCGLLKLRQRRLVTLKRTELPHVADLIQPIVVEDCPSLFCLRSDLPLLEPAAQHTPSSAPQLLAPLDPLIYDRRLTSALWRFDYTWEAYTPPAKRLRGHYALPLLAGTELVGHVDPKADRTAGRLRIVSCSAPRRHRAAATAATRALAAWLGLR